jgi:hypothetical protein
MYVKHDINNFFNLHFATPIINNYPLIYFLLLYPRDSRIVTCKTTFEISAVHGTVEISIGPCRFVEETSFSSQLPVQNCFLPNLAVISVFFNLPRLHFNSDLAGGLLTQRAIKERRLIPIRGITTLRLMSVEEKKSVRQHRVQFVAKQICWVSSSVGD